MYDVLWDDACILGSMYDVLWGRCMMYYGVYIYKAEYVYIGLGGEHGIQPTRDSAHGIQPARDLAHGIQPARDSAHTGFRLNWPNLT